VSRLSTSTERGNRLRIVLSCGVLLLAASGFASAASTGARVDELEIRVDRIDRIVSSQTLVELSQRLDALQAELRAAANAPLFAAQDVYLGSGIVGGRMLRKPLKIGPKTARNRRAR